MNPIHKFIFTAIALMLSATSADAAKMYRQYGYYTISGKNAEQLDEALSRQGPYLKSTGNRHPGASRIRFDPAIKLRKTAKYCRVEKANVDIHAKISLPRWKQRRTTQSLELALIWDVLSQDIKRHEESHVVMARAHASEIEYAVRSLPYRRDCQTLQRDIDKIITRILSRHDREQLRFDRIETKSFNKRFVRLLARRLQKVTLIHNNKRYTIALSE